MCHGGGLSILAIVKGTVEEAFLAPLRKEVPKWGMLLSFSVRTKDPK